ncbi:recombinase family protein [Sphingomonas mucosissima]|uniref:recombinase family protein n=1 Tax=Sphingomonas mucosissima TaxID=370959 RepID=UPI00146DB26E|nr:recombinase family protein [Sphingomonas mucosissima]
MKAAIYARHSSDKQNSRSSADQVVSCEAVVDRLGGTVVGTYADPEISGYRRDRPGLMRLLADVRAGKIDMNVSEALDRIARDGEDINWLGKKLRFDHVKLVTAIEGEIDEIKLAVAGLLGSMFLSNLRHKTFRGMQAAVLAGRLAGGRAYGYRKVDDHTGTRGVMEIDPEQAATVRWIMEQFAGGRSSVSLATELNQRGVPVPRGGQWNASTIRGDPRKQVGILHNPLYRGTILWGRREWRKDPDSDRRERRYRLRDRAEWIEVAVPDLAIITPPLAAAVDRKLAARSTLTTRNQGNGKRAQHLLSGLIKCGGCGSNYTISGKIIIAARVRRNAGPVAIALRCVLDVWRERYLRRFNRTC